LRFAVASAIQWIAAPVRRRRFLGKFGNASGLPNVIT
jgi:hypothetical protein